MSVSTVKGHLAAIQNKLGARNRSEITAWAQESHIMPGSADQRNSNR